MTKTTRTTMAIAALLVLGSSSLALAQAYPRHTVVRHVPSTERPLINSDVALPQGHVPAAEEQWMDRASESYSGGGY